MGIFIIPTILFALACCVQAIFNIMRGHKLKHIQTLDYLGGGIISIILFTIICVIYKMEKMAWGLSPVFRIPIFMIYLPFIISLFIADGRNTFYTHLKYMLLISCCISGIMTVLFLQQLFNLLDHIGVTKYD